MPVAAVPAAVPAVIVFVPRAKVPAAMFRVASVPATLPTVIVPLDPERLPESVRVPPEIVVAPP